MDHKVHKASLGFKASKAQDVYKANKDKRAARVIAENVVKVKDKVPMLGDLPFLGRLFRSERSNTEKKNLMIFVSPRIIDPAGNPIHTEDNWPYDPNSGPTQDPVLETAAGN